MQPRAATIGGMVGCRCGLGKIVVETAVLFRTAHPDCAPGNLDHDHVIIRSCAGAAGWPRGRGGNGSLPTTNQEEG